MPRLFRLLLLALLILQVWPVWAGLLGSAEARKSKKAKPAASSTAGGADAPACKKGKKLCGGKCIPAKKPCKEAAPAAATTQAPPGSEAGGTLSSAAVAAAFQTPAGQAMLRLARTLKQTGVLDVEDKQRAEFRQALRGQRPPLPICTISQVQLKRDCEVQIGGTLALPCVLAVDEMATVCKLIGQELPTLK